MVCVEKAGPVKGTSVRTIVIVNDDFFPSRLEGVCIRFEKSVRRASVTRGVSKKFSVVGLRREKKEEVRRNDAGNTGL